MASPDPRVDWLLRLGDNAVVLSHRLSEWCGHGPVLEEDLALTNVALDLIGQARMWLGYAGEVEGNDRSDDQLAYLRDVADYRNVLLVEQPNGDFAHTMVRQLYFDVWHYQLLEALGGSADVRVADIAAKSLKEVTYHLGRSAEWVVTLGDGTTQSHERMQTAADELWRYTGELFEMDSVEERMAADGVGVDLATLREPWLARLEDIFEAATLTLPDPKAWMARGGKRGVHTENLGFLLAEMQFLQRAYPNAVW